MVVTIQSIGGSKKNTSKLARNMWRAKILINNIQKCAYTTSALCKDAKSVQNLRMWLSPLSEQELLPCIKYSPKRVSSMPKKYNWSTSATREKPAGCTNTKFWCQEGGLLISLNIVFEIHDLHAQKSEDVTRRRAKSLLFRKKITGRASVGWDWTAEDWG